MGGKEGITLQHIRNQIAVGEHGSLGNSRGAAGVLKHGQIITVKNRRAVGRFRPGLQHGIQPERTGYRERWHHPLHIFHEKIDQSTLRLWVKVRYLGNYNGLYTGLG